MPAAEQVRFVAESHEYFFGSERLISVTQALNEAGLINSDWYTDFGRERGTWVHQALEWLDLGELERPEEGNPLLAYIEAYEQFMFDCRVTWDHVELRLVDPARRLAGTLDRAGTLNGRKAVCDLKTGAPERWHAIQLSAYLDLLKTSGYYADVPVIHRYGLYLTADGKYRLIEYTDRRDRQIFNAALTVAQFKRAHQR